MRLVRKLQAKDSLDGSKLDGEGQAISLQIFAVTGSPPKADVADNAKTTAKIANAFFISKMLQVDCFWKNADSLWA